VIVKIEIECPYCDKIHIHHLDVGIPKPKVLEKPEEEKKSG